MGLRVCLFIVIIYIYIINSRTQSVKNIFSLIKFDLFHDQSFRESLCSSSVKKDLKIYEIKVMKLLHIVQLNLNKLRVLCNL